MKTYVSCVIMFLGVIGAAVASTNGLLGYLDFTSLNDISGYGIPANLTLSGGDYLTAEDGKNALAVNLDGAMALYNEEWIVRIFGGFPKITGNK